MLRCFVVFELLTLVCLINSFSVSNNTWKVSDVIKVEARVTVTAKKKTFDSSWDAEWDDTITWEHVSPTDARS